MFDGYNATKTRGKGLFTFEVFYCSNTSTNVEFLFV